MIPLVLLDLDGTVIGSTGQVLPCVWQKVEEVREVGMKLAVCTGRPAMGVAQRVAQRLGPTHPHIFQSGAVVAYPDGEPLKVSALKEAVTRQLIDHARSLSLVLELYTPTALYVERRTEISEAHAKMLGIGAIVRDLQDVARNEPVVRAQWIVTVDALRRVESLDLPGVQVSAATSPVLRDTFFVSVTQKGVSKGSGVQALAEALKIDRKNILAVGDSLGDLPMLEAVGHPLVMGNAAAELLARFDSVGEVDACGVVAALDRAMALTRV